MRAERANHHPTSGASILIVDDSPAQLMTLEAVLEGLADEILMARSGEEALRILLTQDVALILLDVNMPGIDGFETAALIRRRKRSEHTPIIFVTAFSDEMYVARAYSLGAVDFILAPVLPEVIRTKVSVFIELFRKTEQVRRQARFLERRAEQLHRIKEAALSISSTFAVPDVLRIVADAARDISQVREASIGTNLLESWKETRVVRSFAGVTPETRETDLPTSPDDPAQIVCAQDRLVRIDGNGREIDGNGREEGGRDDTSGSAGTTRGALAVPLRARDGRNIGFLCLRDKVDGAFADEDESFALQLSNMASIALENTIYREARETNRLKDEFIATLSHELRTPLNAIMGWTMLLQSRRVSEAESRRGLDVIERNVRAQSRMIEDLLDISRIITGKLRLSMERTSLRCVILAAAEGVAPLALQKALHLDVDAPQEVGEVLGDEDRLQQVLWNLLSNAVKFTPEGGRISIALEATDSRAVIRVRDTGVGIAPALLPHVFDRFRQGEFRLTRSQGGLGIGLTIVRHVIELHGGAVEAWSEGENRGAVFTIRLPLAAPERGHASDDFEGALAAPDAAAEALAMLERRRILVVDDEPDGRELIGMCLAKCGAHVVRAASAAEALERLSETSFDVIVSDIAMPVMDGYRLIAAIRELPGGRVPALALTAFAREQDRSRALAAGFDEHVSKPIEPKELAQAVARLVAMAPDHRYSA